MKHDETKLPKWAQKELGTERALCTYWCNEAKRLEARLRRYEDEDTHKPYKQADL